MVYANCPGQRLLNFTTAFTSTDRYHLSIIRIYHSLGEYTVFRLGKKREEGERKRERERATESDRQRDGGRRGERESEKTIGRKRD